MRLYKLRNTSNINFYGEIHFINEDAGENYILKGELKMTSCHFSK